MTETPRKLVHWDINDVSLSALGSPFFDSSMASVVSTSSLEYINSQLVAHGFAPSPGLILDGIQNSDLERVVKCLLGMLSQRVEDMARTEELTTKLRILTYDHERLRSMHRTATETAANAERETNLHKSRLAAATRALQASEASHKQTTAELQRTRTIVQGIRATHQSELKKKEKDIERMAEKWSRLADAQAKLMTVPSGLRCANVGVVSGSELIGKGQGFLEIALEEAERARTQLGNENFRLKKALLTAVNEMQSILYQARSIMSEIEEEPAPFTLTTLFPLHPPGNASDKLSHVLTSLRETLLTLSQSPATAPPTIKPVVLVSNEEVERLQNIITSLKEELERSRKQTLVQAAETQAMFDKFAEDHRIATGNIGEMSIELMSVPLRDVEKERLDKIKRELEEERQKFTAAAIKLGKERAEIEAERVKLLDEKRSWQVEMMLAELPPTPQPTASPKKTSAIRPSPKKSPRKSPAKVCVGKAGARAGTGRKATRVSRRSLASPIKVTPSYETEVLPPIPAPSFKVKPLPLAASLLPTSFVLPPPSPHASFPTQPALPPPLPAINFHESPPQSTTPLSPTPSPPAEASIAPGPTGPSTPPATRRPFPVAKPFAQRMIHAYSPAKPSPLSRILMLGNSPNSPDSQAPGAADTSSLLQPVAEEDSLVLGFEEHPPPPAMVPQMSLAAELGLPESPPETPLQEKKIQPNVTARGAVTTARGRVFHPEPNRLTAKEKGKGKAEPVITATNARVRTSAGVEKENSGMKSGRVVSAASKVTPPETKKPVKPAPKPAVGVSSSRARVAVKLPPPGKNGPRRVLIDSAEAPPIAKGRKS
ncbi:Afadin- and alpha-actinin-binding protein B [Hypsizygus marmoreus]|uniref:Afadin- and alpha-actinin-binding protein B n=1 Tax=Hypsizygus marmoreus TaxID=39966 RepID=A0A369J905_HYPMA|nr:Afadin- and alpha-actinin-binding protein B [Hypsizygus marmoreus]